MFQKNERVELISSHLQHEKEKQGSVTHIGDSIFTGGDILSTLGWTPLYDVKFFNGEEAECIPEGNLKSVEKELSWKEKVIDNLLKIEQLLKNSSDLTEVMRKEAYSYFKTAKEKAEFTNLNKNLVANNLRSVFVILKDTKIGTEIKSLIKELVAPLDVDKNFFEL